MVILCYTLASSENASCIFGGVPGNGYRKEGVFFGRALNFPNGDSEMSMLKLVTLADDSLNTLVNEIRTADSAVVSRIFEREASHFAKNEAEQLRQRIIIGSIVMSYIRHWNRNDGMKKVIAVLTEKGCPSLDATYCNNAAAFAFFYLRGIDVTLTGGMRNWRAFFTLLQWKAQGKKAHKTTVLEFKKTSFEETLQEILKGTHTHKDEQGTDVKTTIGSLTGVNFARIFGLEEKESSIAPKWNVSMFNGKKPAQVKRSVLAWFNALKKDNNGKNKEVAEIIARTLSEAIGETTITTVPKPEPKAKKELVNALAKA